MRLRGPKALDEDTNERKGLRAGHMKKDSIMGQEKSQIPPKIFATWSDFI